jgi:hypothetical protein
MEHLWLEVMTYENLQYENKGLEQTESHSGNKKINNIIVA